MSKKLTYEYVYNYFKERGCELLESEYINARTKMKFECKCGNISDIIWNSFKQQNAYCRKCSGTEKLTYEYVNNYFKEQNCELLESEYINAKTKMKYRCKCGNEHTTNWNNFQRGKRCINCYKANRLGEFHPNYKIDRSRARRIEYLKFNLLRLDLLKDDPLYDNYLKVKQFTKSTSKKSKQLEYTVDHIFPKKAFIDNNLDKKFGQVLVKKICNLRENLRIIPQFDNGSKGGKYNQEEFIKWFNIKIMKENNFVFD